MNESLKILLCNTNGLKRSLKNETFPWGLPGIILSALDILFTIFKCLKKLSALGSQIWFLWKKFLNLRRLRGILLFY